MKKTQKKIKSIKGGEDRISDLPDHVLHHILSLLPTTKEAIRTGTLSKRWKPVWTLVPNLIFINGYINFDDFSSFVNTTLTLCGPLNLNQFKVETKYDYEFESVIKDWIHYAVRHEVQKLDLLLETEYSGYPYELELEESFYNNSFFTNLNLEGCSFNPSGTIETITWQNLTSLCITFGKLDEDFIKNMLSGSPLLETLELRYCHGFRRIDITSKSVKNLVFSGYSNHELDYDDEEFEEDIIEINAPYISFLAIQEQFELSKLVLLSVSCLVKAYLNYNIESSTRTQEEVEEVSKGLVLSLRHVEDLTAGDLCQEVFSSLKSKGFTFPPNLGS